MFWEASCCGFAHLHPEIRTRGAFLLENSFTFWQPSAKIFKARGKAALSCVPREISHAGLQWKTRAPAASWGSRSPVCLAKKGGLELACPSAGGGARLGGPRGGRRQLPGPGRGLSEAQAPQADVLQRMTPGKGHLETGKAAHGPSLENSTPAFLL